jgi:hypothetical protein
MTMSFQAGAYGRASPVWPRAVACHPARKASVLQRFPMAAMSKWPSGFYLFARAEGLAHLDAVVRAPGPKSRSADRGSNLVRTRFSLVAAHNPTAIADVR